jgi:hypothetical protein
VTTTTITGLTPGTAYNFTVTATNGAGTSSPSSASNTVTVPAVPSAPTLASATTNANGTVTVTWADPLNNGNAITSYGIVPSPACGGCSYSSLSGATVTSATVSGLTRGGTYTFTVTATNGVGTGPASAASNSIVAPNVPSAPTGVTATNGNDAATVSWTAPANGGSAITGYTVTSSTGGLTCSTSGTSCTVSGLTTGTAYTFTVKAINGVGTGSASSPSNSVTAVTTPGAPTIGTATAPSTTSASVAFTAPGSNGGSAITGYTVTATDTTNSSRGGQTATGTVSPIVVTGLTTGDTYTFTVTATNAVGTGAASSASNSLLVALVPGAPTIGTATAGASGTKKATVTFTAPGSNGGSTITSYTVTATDTTNAGRGGQTASGPSSSITVTGLTANDVYTFKVTATNAVGTGTASAASNAITAK